MPDPLIIRHLVTTVTRGVVTIGTDELAGRWRKRATAAIKDPPAPSLEALGVQRSGPLTMAELAALPDVDENASLPTGDLPDLDALPSLDEVRLGDGIADEVRPAGPPLPAELFTPIVGYTFEKRMLRTVVTADRQMSALLIGAPGTAKSLFLDELARLPNTRYTVGTNMSAPGLLDLILDSDEPIHVLLIDELDKTPRETQEALLAVMTGKAVRTKSGTHTEQDVDIRVIAAANTDATIIAPLRSRMVELVLPEMSVAEREKVIAGFLVARQGVAPKDAEEIAALVAPRSADVRDAEQIATVRASDPALAKELADRLRRTGTAPQPHRRRTAK